MRALLDVSVRVALLDPDHPHHCAARDWLARHIDEGWASCALTPKRMHPYLVSARLAGCSAAGGGPGASLGRDGYRMARVVQPAGRYNTRPDPVIR